MKKLIKYIAATVAFMAATACSDRIEPETDRVNEDGMHVYTLQLDASLTDEIGSRAGREWASNDYMYICFENGADKIWSYAYYSSYYQVWNLYTTATLPQNVASGKCTVWFIDGLNYGSISSSTTELSLQATNSVYHDATTYSIVNGTVVITADLTPMTGRFRMRSSSYNSSTYLVAGPTVPVKLSLTDNSLDLGRESVSFTTTRSDDNDGYYYSDYFCGYYFDEDTDREFKVRRGNNIFVRSYAGNNNVLAPGSSGYIDVPSESSHEGWEMAPYLYYSSGAGYYGNTSDITDKELSYFFSDPLYTIESAYGVKATVRYDIEAVYSGEGSKKEALLYIVVYDGDPDAEGATQLTQASRVLYKPNSGIQTGYYFTEELELTLPSSFVTTNTPYYRVYILTDGVRVYVSSLKLTNFF